MSKTIRLTESEMVTLIEQFAPKELKRYIKNLPHIDCTDNKGNKHICTTIPEVIHVYLSGRY